MDVAGPAAAGGLPPSAGLRREPEVPVRPDFSERWTRRIARSSDRHPRSARRLRQTYALGSWLALGLLVAALIGVPSMRPALAVGLGLLVLLAQLAVLSRSRTVSFASCARTFVAGALLAVPIGLAEAAAATSLGLAVDDPPTVVYLAGPIEELLKLTPLLLLAVCARHRVRRFAVVDFGLIAAAAGAGFQLAEDAVRRVTAPPGALVGPLDMAVGIQYAWTHLLPGWVDWGTVRFPGHAVLTGLVGLGIGLAVRTRRRYGRVVWLLPLGCLFLAVLDHMGWADAVHELFAGHVLPWPARLAHSLFGAGHGARWLLLTLLLAAVVLDFRAVRRAGEMLPPLPGTAPGRGLVARAEAAAVRIGGTVPDYAAAVFHRLARAVGVALIASADALVQALHEGAVFLVAARRGPMVFFSALRFVRDRRELAQAIHHAAGRPRRDVPPRADVHRRSGLLASTLLPGTAGPAGWASRASAPGPAAVVTAVGAVAAVLAAFGVLLAGAAGGAADDSAYGPVGTAFVATVADELVRWWYGLTPAGGLLAPLGTAGLLAVLGGVWSPPAATLTAPTLPAATLTGATLTGANQAGGGTAGFLRDPGRATRELLSNLTPGQVLYFGAARSLGWAAPEGTRRLLERDRPDAGTPGRPSSRLCFPPWQLRKRYAHCGPLFGLPSAYTPRYGEQLREALQEFVDAPDTVHVGVGRYRGQPAVIHYDPRKRIAVVFRPDGELWSGWRLSAAQYHELVTLGVI